MGWRSLPRVAMPALCRLEIPGNFYWIPCWSSHCALLACSEILRIPLLFLALAAASSRLAGFLSLSHVRSTVAVAPSIHDVSEKASEIRCPDLQRGGRGLERPGTSLMGLIGGSHSRMHHVCTGRPAGLPVSLSPPLAAGATGLPACLSVALPCCLVPTY